DIGELFDAAAGVRPATRRAGPLSAARFVADLARTPRYAPRSAPAGSAKSAPAQPRRSFQTVSHGRITARSRDGEEQARNNRPA
ncbi:hypothetical protein, partial [Rhodovulum sp. PH10]|uniref:hypothetical protein n=1 Tax=Rhodovulum sp. PH10 TaxID=1187851 RepID=UPI001ED8DBEA